MELSTVRDIDMFQRVKRPLLRRLGHVVLVRENTPAFKIFVVTPTAANGEIERPSLRWAKEWENALDTMFSRLSHPWDFEKLSSAHIRSSAGSSQHLHGPSLTSKFNDALILLPVLAKLIFWIFTPTRSTFAQERIKFN